MKLRNKISIIVGVFWIAMVVSVYLGSRFIIQDSFIRLEEESAVSNMQRVNQAIYQMENAVNVVLGSWAIWDDTYRFMADKNKKYIDSNLTISSFTSSDLDMIVYFDKAGKIFSSIATDPSRTKEMPLPEGLNAYFSPQGKIVYQPNIDSGITGLIKIPSGILIIASHSIVTSANTGPVRGTIMMARYLSEKTIKELNEITKVKTSIYPLSNLSNVKGKEEILNTLKSNPYAIIKSNDKELIIYGLLNDVNNKPIALIEANLPRSIYQIGLDTIYFYNLVGVVSTLMLLIILWLSIHSLVVRRIEKLKRVIVSGGSNIELLKTVSKDEIGMLAKAFDETQKELEAETHELEKTNQHLEIAQQIARLDYCFYDHKTDQITWPRRTNKILSLNEVLATMHPDDRSHFSKMVNAVLTEATDQECEIRVEDHEPGHYRWYYTIGHPYSNTKPIEQMTIVIMDITRRKKSEEELNDLQKKLLLTARQAGMSEVATSVLHNVGNVLNSAKVSMQLLQENMEKPNFKNLVQVSQMIKKNLNNIKDYIDTDPKGKILPEYLTELIVILEGEHTEQNDTINLLSKSIKHIEDIVAIQQTISGVANMKDKVIIAEAIDAGLQVCQPKIAKHHITIKKDFRSDLIAITDQAKLLQIIINLITNSIDSMLAKKDNGSEHVLTITTKKIDQNSFSIAITDNGVGISPENKVKIFSLGFTTKIGGHGFGLHSSAIIAKELSGQLQVESGGVEKGATFTLTLPLIISKGSEYVYIQ